MQHAATDQNDGVKRWDFTTSSNRVVQAAAARWRQGVEVRGMALRVTSPCHA
jgi:hypothetical protein